MNELQIFNNDEFGQIRSIEIEGEPWFVGKDVAAALKYSDTRKAVITHVYEDDRTLRPITDALGREQETTLVNESGIYALIFGSKLESAKRFQRWVTSEVIPAIRKTGKYEIQQTPKTYLEALKALVAAEEEKQQMAIEMVAMSEKIEEMQPKITYLDKILESTDTMLVTQIAQDYGMSARGFNKLLHDLSIQRKVNGQWILYHDYIGNGYTHSHTHKYDKSDGSIGTKENTEWTQKGRLFLYNILKEHGFIPLIERREHE